MKVFDVIINALFPNKCISCGSIIDRRESLCDYCYSKIERVDIFKVCKRCGLPKKQCECKNRVFHFNGVTAPFYSEDIAKAAMYRFKFKKLSFCSRFFAFEMAKAVKGTYFDKRFDGIVYVPMSNVKELKRGFNQSEELAKGLSKILGIKLYNGVIRAKHNPEQQHDMHFKERFENVKGIYFYNKNVTGKTILLVDDIKTTGATLDECAKQLLLAGANDVYCVTGLITKPKERENINGS
jgi:ComF family protein